MPGGGKVLLIVGDAVETVDTLYPYFRLQEDGMTTALTLGPGLRR